MEKERIKALLRDYRITRARAACLESEIALLRKQFALAQRPEALIRENALAARPAEQCGSRGGMPGDPAARLACAAADGDAALNPYSDALRAAQSELILAQHQCRMVEAWLGGLCEREKWVVERHAIDHLSFGELTERCEREHGRAYCLDTLKTLYRRGIEDIMRMTA